jgi:hypothetical protein
MGLSEAQLLQQEGYIRLATTSLLTIAEAKL